MVRAMYDRSIQPNGLSGRRRLVSTASAGLEACGKLGPATSPAVGKCSCQARSPNARTATQPSTLRPCLAGGGRTGTLPAHVRAVHAASVEIADRDARQGHSLHSFGNRIYADDWNAIKVKALRRPRGCRGTDCAGVQAAGTKARNPMDRDVRRASGNGSRGAHRLAGAGMSQSLRQARRSATAASSPRAICTDAATSRNPKMRIPPPNPISSSIHPSAQAAEKISTAPKPMRVRMSFTIPAVYHA